jgi:hypothetical protein
MRAAWTGKTSPAEKVTHPDCPSFCVAFWQAWQSKPPDCHAAARLAVTPGVVVMVNAGRQKSLQPHRKTLKILKERFANEIIEIFGIHVEALTANEAQYLVGFRSADEIRNRLLKAKQEVDIRLRSKGIAGIFGREDSPT